MEKWVSLKYSIQGSYRQNILSKRFMWVSPLGSVEPRQLRLFSDRYNQFIGLGGTDTPRECAGLARRFAFWGLDSRFCCCFVEFYRANFVDFQDVPLTGGKGSRD